MEEEFCCELWEGVVGLVLNVENVINNDIVNDNTSNDSNHDQNTGFRE